jgi:hypothetical protein
LKKLTILALLGFAPVFAATTTCTGHMNTPIEGNLVVPAGATTCTLNWVDVAGNTTVQGRLISFTSHFHGNVSVTGAGIIQIINGWSGNSPIEGNLTIQNTVANTDPNVYNGIFCPEQNQSNIVNGNIILTNNAGIFYVCSASVGGNVVANNNTGRLALGGISAVGNIVINGNTGGVELDNVSAGSNLVCQGNSPAPATTTYGGNSAAGQKLGQCAGL